MVTLSKQLWFLTFAVCFVMQFQSPAIAASTEAKKLEKAIASYTKYIEKAEQKSCNTETGKSAKSLSRSCARDIKALDKRFNRYSDAIKADSTINRLTVRHEKLRSMVKIFDHQATVDKIAYKYRLHIEKMETKTCPKKESYGTRTDELCLEDVMKADKIKADIPEEMLTEPTIQDLVKRHNALSRMPAYMASIIAGKKEVMLAGIVLSSEFNERVHQMSYWNRLKDGKANKSGKLVYLEGLNKHIEKYKIFATDCQGKFAEYIQDKPDKQATCELAEHAELYRDRYAAAAYQQFLKEETEQANAISTRLKEDGFIDVPDYNRLVVRNNDYIQDVEKRVGDSQKKLDLPIPSYIAFEKAVYNIPDALQSATSKNRWSDNNTIPVSKPIEKLTDQIVKNWDMELVKIGRLDQPWVLVKNELGIPLYKMAKGWVMMKNSNESFCRIQHATYTRTYDGTGYAPASNINIVQAIVPAPCE